VVDFNQPEWQKNTSCHPVSVVVSWNERHEIAREIIERGIATYVTIKPDEHAGWMADDRRILVPKSGMAIIGHAYFAYSPRTITQSTPICWNIEGLPKDVILYPYPQQKPEPRDKEAEKRTAEEFQNNRTRVRDDALISVCDMFNLPPSQLARRSDEELADMIRKANPQKKWQIDPPALRRAVDGFAAAAAKNLPEE